MNTLVRVRGWVNDCNLLNPTGLWFDDVSKFSLALHPEFPSTYQELDDLALSIRHENESPYEVHPSADPGYKDRIIEGCLVIFETIHEPKLIGELQSRQSDDELVGKFVQVTGHIQRHKLGNLFLSMHFVEPAFLQSDDFDPAPQV